MLYVYLVLLILIYFFSFKFDETKKAGIKLLWLLRGILFVTTPLLVAIVTAQSYNIFPRGYWFTKGLFWLVFLSIVSIYGLIKKELIRKYERRLYKVIFISPLFFILFLFIPFIGIGTALLFYINFIGNDKYILYHDNNIRIEQPYIRFLGPDPHPVLYVKQSFFSYRDTILPFAFREDEDSVLVKKLTNDTYEIIHIAPDNEHIPSGSETFQYQLKHN